MTGERVDLELLKTAKRTGRKVTAYLTIPAVAHIHCAVTAVAHIHCAVTVCQALLVAHLPPKRDLSVPLQTKKIAPQWFGVIPPGSGDCECQRQDSGLR